MGAFMLGGKGWEARLSITIRGTLMLDQAYAQLHGTMPSDVAYRQQSDRLAQNNAMPDRQRLIPEIIEGILRVYGTLEPANSALYELEGRLFGYQVSPPSAQSNEKMAETDEAQLAMALQRLTALAVEVQVKAQRLNARI